MSDFVRTQRNSRLRTTTKPQPPPHPDQRSLSFDGREQRGTLTVGDLTARIKEIIESDDQLTDVWVRGEISNFKRHTSGHLYFTLKDATAQLKVVMFRREAIGLQFEPEDGARVICRGSVSVFEKQGQYQLYVSDMRFDGVGSLYERFERLKKKLDGEGLFDRSRKKPIPKFPRVVGIATSTTGAAIRDLISIIRRRSVYANVLVIPTIVQGPDAPGSIIGAIRMANDRLDVDVLIVGRGGGSMEDLWAFNNERLARFAAASRVPIVSAVGHETDFTILDFVADLRASTPSAAAELVVPNGAELNTQLANLGIRMRRALTSRAEVARHRLLRLLSRRSLAHPDEFVRKNRQEVDELLERSFRATERTVSLKRQSIHRIDGQLVALDPRAVLRRGYAIFRYPEADVISSVLQAIPGREAEVQLSDGRVRTNIEGITEETT